MPGEASEEPEPGEMSELPRFMRGSSFDPGETSEEPEPGEVTEQPRFKRDV